ncbi:MAG: hypothetical protein AMXMBFR84_17360 [Candidatus Hydrogenedentota bacterium]
MDIVYLILGTVVLILGAEVLVRGAAQLAVLAKISPLIVGLTVVAFGTSAPELAVSVMAGWSGNADVALGNVVGSNIFNILLILGVAAVITPLTINQQLIRLDVPIMIGSCALTWLLGLDGSISRLDGTFLFALVILYTGFLVYHGRKQGAAETGEIEDEVAELTAKHMNPFLAVVCVAVGLALLVLGSRWLVFAAVSIAESLGVSQLIIGLTIVAAGTSLPEVATSVMASLRGHRDIAVGNVVGSSIFNILAVLGLSSAISPSGVVVAGEALTFDIPIMVAVSLACLPVFISGSSMSRFEGALFLFYYASYMTLLVLEAMGNNLIGHITNVYAFGLLPATGVVLMGSLVLSEKRMEKWIVELPSTVQSVAWTTILHTRKVIVFVIGATVLVGGLALLVLPGPAFIVIPVGLAILATEFVWARTLLIRIQNKIKESAAYVTGKSQGGDS